MTDSDLANRLLQMQQAASGGKPPGTILGILPANVEMGGQLKLETAAGFGNKQIMPGSGVAFGKSGGLGDKFLQAFQRAFDEIKQCGAQAGVMYSGDLPSGNLPSGSVHGGGGSFASQVGSSHGSGGHEVG